MSRIADLSVKVSTRVSFHQFRSHPRRLKVISTEDPGQCFHRVPMKRRTREAGGGHISSQSLPSMERKRRQLNINREPRTGRRADGRAKGGRGPRVVIYEVSKTLYTPTRQRAGLAPRNPVLALTHRYLSHAHFRPIRARGGTLHTYVRPRASFTLHAGVFTIYSAPRVGNAVGYLVDIVYLGTVHRMIHVISHPGYRHDHRSRGRSVNETIA